jgi:myo-inositol 2-dehydrogenase / D-chiro-inositol 1-dehydrogenase
VGDAVHPIRLGMIGAGRAANLLYLPVLARLPGIDVTALADTDSARLSEVARRHCILQQFPSHAILLEEAEVDAVAVVTPTPSHAAIALEVLRAGKHLFLDKPMAMNRKECDRLVEAAQDSRGKVLIGHNFRWHRLVNEARRKIKSGLLGSIKAIRSLYTHEHNTSSAQEWHRRRSSGGGVLFNDGVHHFDLWRFLLETEVLQVRCDASDSKWFEDDTCSVSARLANGALASAVFCFSTTANSEIEIFGEEGSLLLSLYRFDGLDFTPRGILPGGGRKRLRQWSNLLRSLPAGLAAARHGGDFDATYNGIWRHWADCLLHNNTPACTPKDGRAAVAVAIACIESASTGKTVQVSQG